MKNSSWLGISKRNKKCFLCVHSYFAITPINLFPPTELFSLITSSGFQEIAAALKYWIFVFIHKHYFYNVMVPISILNNNLKYIFKPPALKTIWQHNKKKNNQMWGNYHWVYWTQYWAGLAPAGCSSYTLCTT